MADTASSTTSQSAGKRAACCGGPCHSNKPTQTENTTAPTAAAAAAVDADRASASASASVAAVSPAASAQPSSPRASFYRRPLPANLIAFSSDEGRRIFAESLAAGTMECYFRMAEQFHTQSEPAYCGLGTLTMCLNALEMDPGRRWKGVWRWYSEELLDCCVPLTHVQKEGVTLEQFACLARCNGADVELVHCDQTSLDAFRDVVRRLSRDRDTALALSYGRSALGQTGAGHFSPMGGYNESRDLVLLMDVARFKYPPHWCPLETLWRAMNTTDTATGALRGYCVITKGTMTLPTFQMVANPATFTESLRELPSRVTSHMAAQRCGSVADVARAALSSVPETLLKAFKLRGEADLPEAVVAAREQLLSSVDKSLMLPVVARAASDLGLTVSPEELRALTLMACVTHGLVASSLEDAALRRQWLALFDMSADQPLVREVRSLRQQAGFLSQCYCGTNLTDGSCCGASASRLASPLATPAAPV